MSSHQVTYVGTSSFPERGTQEELATHFESKPLPPGAKVRYVEHNASDNVRHVTTLTPEKSPVKKVLMERVERIEQRDPLPRYKTARGGVYETEEAECIGRRENVEYIYDTEGDEEYERRIQELKAQIASARGNRIDTDKYTVQISRLHREADTDEARIASLKAQLQAGVTGTRGLSHNNDTVDNLHRDLELRNARIAELKEALLASHQMQPVVPDVSGYERTISGLEHDVREARGKIVDVKPYEREIQQLKETNHSDQARIRHLREEIERVKRLLATAPVVHQVPRDFSKCPPFVGFGLMEKTGSDKHQFVDCLPVESLWSDGPAEKAGLRLDDEVFHLGSTNAPIQSLAQIHDIIRDEARVGERLRVVARHPGEHDKFTTYIDVGTVGESCREHGDVYYDRSAHRKLGGSLNPTVSDTMAAGSSTRSAAPVTTTTYTAPVPATSSSTTTTYTTSSTTAASSNKLEVASVIEFDAVTGEAPYVEEKLLPTGRSIVASGEPGTPLWYGLQQTPLLALKQTLKPQRFAILDFFHNEDGQRAHFQGDTPQLIRDNADIIQGGFDDGVLSNCSSYQVLASKILSHQIPHAKYVSFITLRCSSAKNAEIKSLLMKGLELAQGEPKTSLSAVCQSQRDANDFAIIDIIDDEDGVNTHFTEPAVVPSAFHRACKDDPSLLKGGFESGFLSNIRLFRFVPGARKDDVTNLSTYQV